MKRDLTDQFCSDICSGFYNLGYTSNLINTETDEEIASNKATLIYTDNGTFYVIHNTETGEMMVIHISTYTALYSVNKTSEGHWVITKALKSDVRLSKLLQARIVLNNALQKHYRKEGV